jgi:excisionase family DNA binding protein
MPADDEPNELSRVERQARRLSRALGPPPPVERLCSYAEVAQHYGVSRHTVYAWAAAGQIRVVRTPGGWPRVPESELRPRTEDRRR